MERPFEAYRGEQPYIFVSYAHADAEWVFPQFEWLHAQGLRIFYDEGIPTGSVWRDALADAIANCALCVYFASPRSVASPVCQQEVGFALARKRPVLVVFTEPCVLPAGIEMALGHIQALQAAHFDEPTLRERMLSGIRNMLDRSAPFLPPDVGTAERAIGVLPFRSIGSDDAYLAEGIAEELLTVLHQVPALRVLSRGATFACRDSDEDPRILGQRLGASFLLEGGVQRAGERVRVTARLIDVGSGSQLWSQRYDRGLEDLFALQDDIAALVLQAVTRQVNEGERPGFDWGTTDAGAYRKFLMGRAEYRKFGVDALELACDYFRLALQIDPHFERARISLIGSLESLRMLMDADWIAAEIGAEIDLVERDDPAHDRHDWIWLERLRDPRRDSLLDLDASERMFREILCDPAHPSRRGLRFNRWSGGGFVADSEAFPERAGRACYGLLLAQSGLYRAGLEMLRPANPSTSAIGCLLTLLGDLEEARAFYRMLAEAEPDQVLLRVSQIALHERMGEHEAADAALARARALMPPDVALAARLVIAGWRDDDATLQAHVTDVEAGHLPLFFKGLIAAYSDAERAVSLLQQALEKREMLLMNIRIWAPTLLPQRCWQRLSAAPGMQALVAEIGVDEVWRAELCHRANTLVDVTGVHVSLDD